MIIRSIQAYTVYHVHMPQPAWRPPTDIFETETDLVIQIEVAGMRDGHFHVSVHNRELAVYGTRTETARERRAYHQMELNRGDFRVETELPAPVDVNGLQAEYDDGFLRITLPKAR